MDKIIKFPKSLGDCADKYYELKEQRLKAEKVAKAIEEEEKAYKEHIIENLPKSSLTGAMGKIACAKIVAKIIPQVEDWEKLYAHIKKTGDFDLLGRTVSKSGVESRWEAKKKVPGVGTFQTVTISLTKV
jgi:hypothetical protein